MNKKRVLSLLCSSAILLSALFAAVPAQAEEAARVGRDYYVSNQGDNSNDGSSPTKAFQTLDKLEGITFQPGDRILLETGSVFTGYIHPKGSGNEENPIIIDAYEGGKIGEETDGAKPIINADGEGIWYQDYGKPMDNGTNTNSYNTTHKGRGFVSAAILLYDVEYYEISNLEITNNKSYKGIDDLSDEMLDKAGIAGVAQDNGTIDHIYLNNLYIHDVNGNILHKHMNNGGIQMNVYKPTKETAEIARYNDIKIENCRVENVSRFGITVGYTYNWNQFQTAELADETVQTYGHTNIVIRNNYVKEAGGDAITPMYSLRPLVEYNISDTAAYDIQRKGSRYTVDAAVWPWKCKDAVFQFNEIFDTVANADGQAFDCDYGDGAIYQYNYTHDNGGGFAMLCGGQAINSIIRYNISQNDLDGLLSLPDNPNGVFYNNTFYTRPGLNTPLLRPSMTGGITEFYNNIVYNAGDAMTVNDWRPSQVTFKNNIFYGYTNTPGDATNVIADPKFVDPGKGGAGVYGDSAIDTLDGYKLQEGSPAINAGMFIVNNGGRDYFGNPVRDLTPDIGAYESGTPSTTPKLEAYSELCTINQTTKKITGLAGNTSYQAFMDSLTYDAGVTANVYDGEAQVTSGMLSHGMKLRLTQGAQTVEYTIVSKLQVSSNLCTFDQSAKTIVGIPKQTSYQKFMDSLRYEAGVTVTLYNGDTIVTSGNVTSGMTLKATLGSETIAYSIPLQVTSNLCTIDTSANVILNLPDNTSYDAFMSSLFYDEGVTVELYSGETLVTAGNVAAGMTLKATAGSYTTSFVITREYSVTGMTATDGNHQSGHATEGPASYTLDNNLNTIWHTDWNGSDRSTHWVTIDMGGLKNVSYFKYVPRQGGGTNGMITAFEIQVSSDGITFDKVAEGTWSRGTTQYAMFNTKNARYVKLVVKDALSQNAGLLFASAAELRVGGPDA